MNGNASDFMENTSKRKRTMEGFEDSEKFEAKYNF